MNKLLMTAAIVGVAFVATPAKAEVELGLGGHFKGYVTWLDQDEDESVEVRSFDIIRETEIHFTGETVLDNGLTVGFHAEAEADGFTGGGDTFDVEESYAYFAGNWGRVNFGAEDGAAYLLQVAAPAADSNVDGIRQYVDAINVAGLPDNTDGVPAAGVFDFSDVNAGLLDYDHVASGFADKLTYITPVFNGFQAAASYTPDAASGASFGNNFDDTINAYGDFWEAAARYEGQFNAVRLALGAGYSISNLEDERAAGAFVVGDSTDDIHTWNFGANFGFGPFNVGGAYLHSDNGDIASAVAGGNPTDTDSDSRTWVLGADYTTGPFVIGASYLNRDDENAVGGIGTAGGANGNDLESDRWSGGVTYTYGPGMTFRGSVHHVEYEYAAEDADATSFLLGTQIGF